MPHYVLLSYLPTDRKPTPEEIAEEHPRWAKYAQELTDAGLLVATYGMQGPEVATTVRVRDGETLMTDGPFAETKEYLGGFWVISAPDLDAALEWATKASAACMGPVEVRPFQDEPEG